MWIFSEISAYIILLSVALGELLFGRTFKALRYKIANIYEMIPQNLKKLNTIPK